MENFNHLGHNMYVADIFTIIRFCVPWSFNRYIDENKVTELYEALKNSKKKIMWMIQVAKDTKDTIDDNADNADKLTILDGHHRYHAMRRLLFDNSNIGNEKIFVYVYHIDNPEFNPITLEIFKKINNNVQIKDEDIIDYRVISIVNALAKHFPKAIQQKDTSNYAIKPRIHKKELRKLFEQNKEIFAISIDTLFERILNFNKYLLKKNNNELIMSENDLNKIKKARELNFMLNIPKYPPNLWISEVNSNSFVL